MMASVSIAARESLRVSTVSLLNSQDRSFAVRKVHLPPMRSRFTPRVAYSSCSRTRASRTFVPCGRRAASDFSSSGSAEANNIASSSRSSSARGCTALSGSSSGTTTCNLGMLRPPLFLAAGRRRHAARIGYSTSSRLTLTHIEGRKCRLLVHLHHAFTHQFERGGEARREHRRCKRWLYHERDQIFIEPRPVGRLADQPLERHARLGQGPHAALDQAHMAENRLLPLLRVRREQIVECRSPFRTFDMGDGLWLAALKHVPIELCAAEQALGGGPDRLEALEPHGERDRHIFRALTCRRIRIGQEQARLQVGEPGRHHKIVGGQFEPKLARRLDEGEVLVRKRKDRDPGEIDLLLAGKRQEEVERPLKPFDVDHQGGLARLPLGSHVGFELDPVGGHDVALRAPAGAAMSAVHSARSAPGSHCECCPRRRRAASLLAAASPVSMGTADATACISSSLPLQCRTRSQPAAMAARERASIDPDRAPMEMSSLISKPRNCSKPRITSRTRVTEVVAGAIGSMALYTIWAVIPSGRSDSGPNAAKSVATSVARSVSTRGSTP